MPLDDALRAALDPRSVAVIGASDNPNKVGGRPIHFLSKFGFRGQVYPINPTRAEIQGYKAYPDLAALPEAPELVVVAIPGEAGIQAVDACAERGVKVCIVMASGFGETGEAGMAAQRAMVARARARGMRIVGPNSQGLANFGTGAVANFATMFIEAPPADGPVGIVSQSGATSLVPYALLRGRGIGVRYVCATGNDADLTAVELAEAMVADPEIRLLLIYLEGMTDATRLASLAAAARERDLPVVALKAGRTAAGAQAARSHTGSLAGEDRVIDAFLKRHGIWRASDMHDWCAAAELYLKGWRPGGRRLVAISNSGASCVMAADRATELDLPLGRFQPETVTALKGVLPGFATTTNPIDVTAALLSNSRLFSDVLPIVGRDPAADLFFIAIPVAGAGYDVPAFARDTAQFMADTGKPVALGVPQPNIAAVFAEAGIPTYPNETTAMRALAQLAAHTAMMRRSLPAMPAAAPVTLPAGTKPFLGEADSLALLAAQGMPVVAHRLCRTEAEARAAFAELGGPVAVKACSADVPHKSEHGLVALGLADADAVAATFQAQMAGLQALGAEADGVIVARMVKGRRELVLGARRDPMVGPAVLVGDGGKYVEALGDVAVLVPPFTAEDVVEALMDLRIAPILRGTRGEPALDLATYADAAVRLGAMMLAAGGAIASVDLNPVMVGAAGEPTAIVDALVERGADGAG
ncbi:pimeloyl-CoA synthetase [Allostella sp. ATCC 35155]|nr:pimeloyl-CoA synthetase [Stella sp. ATCC 35155]